MDLVNAIKDRKFETLFSSLKTLKDGYDKINLFLGASNSAYEQGLHRTHFGDHPCVFTSAPGCGQILFPNGFNSIYTYVPADGLEGLVGLPVPIIVIVRSQLTGEYQFATPPFVPFKPGQDL